MMTRALSVRSLFVTALLGVSMFTLGAARTNAGTKTTTPDTSSINQQVHHKLAMLPWYGVFDNLAYQVNGTEVTLTGEVISEHGVTKDDAGKQ